MLKSEEAVKDHDKHFLSTLWKTGGQAARLNTVVCLQRGLGCLDGPHITFMLVLVAQLGIGGFLG